MIKLTENFLENKFNEPLYKDDYVLIPKYQHVERLGNENVEGILNGEVIIQTKLDGANVTISTDSDNDLLIFSRNNVIYKKGKVINNFEGACDYILSNPTYTKLAQSGIVLRGEWLVKHTVLYNQDAYRKFYIFDVESKDKHEYYHPNVWQGWAEEAKVPYIKTQQILTNPDVSELVDIVKGPDEYGAVQKEGIVIKNYQFVNKFGRVTWAKMISEDFREKNKLAFGSSKTDAPEIKFVADYISRGFILKTIHKIEEQKGIAKLPVQYMRAVLDMVWYDAFTEELWDFVKKENVRNFDFKAARKLCETKTRDVALAYFNGLPDIFGDEGTDLQTKV